MRISELIAHLTKVKANHGDLEVWSKDAHECDARVTEASVWLQDAGRIYGNRPATLWIMGTMGDNGEETPYGPA